MQPTNVDNIAAVVTGPRGPAGDVSAAQLQAAIDALKGGVDPAGDTLAELYALILARATLNQIAAFTVSPTVPTLAPGNNSSKAANSAFVHQEIVNTIVGLQPLDALLTAISALVTSADKLMYFTGVDTVAQTPLTAFIRTLLDDADGPTALVTLGALALAGGTMTGALTLNADPVSALHAATKQYVDGLIQGISVKYTATWATVTSTPLPANTYANGTVGVGATLTGNANGALTVDGQAAAAGQYGLVKDEAAGSHNGLYLVTQAGDASHPYILTRATVDDTAAEMSGAFCFVETGTVNNKTGWLCATTGITVGTTAIVFTQFSGAGTYTAGTGLSLAGSQFAISDAELLALAGLISAADRLPYFTGSGAAALAVFTSYARTLAACADAAAVKSALAVALADITDASANGRSLVAAVNYAAMRTQLGLGSAATKATGTSAADPGTGTLEMLLPIQTVTGASKADYATTGIFMETRRSNAGSAMTDTFPASSATGLANGTKIVVANVDATASVTITPGAGTTISGTGVVGPGRAIQYVYDLPNTIWRPTLNTGTALLGPNNLSDLSSAATSRTNLGLGAVDNTSDATKNSASVTLTNHTLDNSNTVTLKDTLFTLQDDGDTTKQARFQLSGIATATTRSFTLPDANTTLLGADNTATVSNKSISGGSNTLSNIGNASLTNSSMTIAGHSVSLGGTQTLAASDLTNGTTGTAGSAVVLATAPSIAGAAIFSGTAKFTTNGTGMLTVGSGTAVYGGGAFLIAAGANSYMEITDGTRSFLFGADVGGTFFGSYSNHDLVLRANNTEGARVQVGGTFLSAAGIIATGPFATKKGSVAVANGLNSNISTPASSFVRLTGPTAAFSVGGFTGGTDGYELQIYNTVAFAMTIVNEDASSTAGNRIKTLTGADVTLRAGTSSARFKYDTSDSRWVLTATN